MQLQAKFKNLRDTLANFHETRDIQTADGRKLYNYKAQKAHYYASTLDFLISDFKKAAAIAARDNDSAIGLLQCIKSLEAEKNNPERAGQIIEKMAGIIAKLDAKEEKTANIFTQKDLAKLPHDIKDEIFADIKEIEKCCKSGCYRSVTILCGRILEAALHRKYYEATGKDILETSPGIGLGNLIAKLKEKNIPFEPGLTEQIHLINQVRVFSVHKKQAVFMPSMQQAHAMILYTIDVLRKLF